MTNAAHGDTVNVMHQEILGLVERIQDMVARIPEPDEVWYILEWAFPETNDWFRYNDSTWDNAAAARAAIPAHIRSAYDWRVVKVAQYRSVVEWDADGAPVGAEG